MASDPTLDTDARALADGMMHRREAIKRVSMLLGGVALVGGTSILQGCAGDRTPSAKSGAASGSFSADDIAYLDEIADTILPDTKTPGAKAAKVGAFMAVMVTDCYDAKDQTTFRRGMKTLNDACQTMHTTSFMKATSAQRLALLEQVDRDTKQYMDAKPADQPTHYFRMIKELTLLGYFTSEIGMTKALRYTETPGRYDPCVPYTKGETSWANHA